MNDDPLDDSRGRIDYAESGARSLSRPRRRRDGLAALPLAAHPSEPPSTR